jgi:hypothetical protein
VKSKIFNARLEIQEELVSRVIQGNSFADNEAAELRRLVESIEETLKDVDTENTDAEANGYQTSFDDFFKNQIVELHATMLRYETAFSSRQVLYNRAQLHAPTEFNDSFRQGVLKHLSATIYVKESRHRYQME